MLEEVKEIIEYSIQKCINGHPVERPNLEFKSIWPNLKSKNEDYYKFVRNLCSIANSVSDKFGIIIFGFNEKTREFVDTSFRDTGLRDTSELQKLITKNITEPFPIEIDTIDIEENTLSVIIIPKSYAKPHVMGEYKTFKNEKINNGYKNYIPVRKETNINTANKYDLDLMYYDRKNMVFDKKTILTPLSVSIENIFGLDLLKVLVTVENIGIRYIAFRNFYIDIELRETQGENRSRRMNATSFRNVEYEEIIRPGDKNIIIKPNSIVDLEVSFSNLVENQYKAKPLILNEKKFKTIFIAETIDGKLLNGEFQYFFDLGDREINSV